MEITHFDRFLLEATVGDTTYRALEADCFYGLYISWCLLNDIAPVEDIAFRAAMRRCGVKPGSNQRRMTGPAATDYILASYPASV